MHYDRNIFDSVAIRALDRIEAALQPVDDDPPAVRAFVREMAKRARPDIWKYLIRFQPRTVPESPTVEMSRELGQLFMTREEVLERFADAFVAFVQVTRDGVSEVVRLPEERQAAALTEVLRNALTILTFDLHGDLEALAGKPAN